MADLYHYTTGAGLLGMLKNYSADNKNLTMWATHYMYMNDPIEYTYGDFITINIIDEIEAELEIAPENRIKEFVKSEEYKQVKRRVMLHAPTQNVNSPYIISLSRANDSLHMWNMYAINGNGLAIKFIKDELTLAKILSRDCIYYNGCNDDVLRDIKPAIKKEYLTLAQECIDLKHDKVQRANYIYSLISALYGIRIKHNAYEIEKEVRIVPQKADKDILFREKNGMIIPYVEQSIPFNCVESITVGPTADFYRVRESILIMLNHKGILWDDSKIIPSQVPYRSL